MGWIVKVISLRVGKKGQITLPIEVKRAWGLREGSELVLFYDEEEARIKPKKRIRVRDFSGALGEPQQDELDFSVLDPELVPHHYREKYGNSLSKPLSEEN